MTAVPHRPEAGRMLKAARMRVRLSTREVDRLSQIWQRKKSQDHYATLISNFLLDSSPNRCKLH